MKKLVYTFLAVMSLSLMSCEKDSLAERESLVANQMDRKGGDEDEEKFNISGLITSSATGLAEEGLTVKLFKSHGEALGSDITNNTGNFNFSVEANDYYFEVYKDGSLSLTSGTISVVADMSVHLVTP